jgi:hypothetical protein
MDWVLPTDEILAVAEAATSEESAVARAADPGVKEHGPTAQLKKLAMHFKLAF